MAKKFLFVFLASGVLLALLPGAADARWARGRSTVEVDGNDKKVCEDELVFETFLDAEQGAIGDAEEGDAYPFPDPLRLWATEAEVLDRVSGGSPEPLLTIDFNPTLVQTTSDRYLYEGETTVPTPAGLSDGDQLWAVSSTETGDVGGDTISFTIGDAIYGCDDDALEAIELNMNVWTWQNRIYFNSWFKYVVAFDNANVDTSTLQISVDNGGTASTPYWGRWGNRGFTSFSAKGIGVNCDSTQLTLTATSNDGDPMAGTYNIDPRGPGCWW